MLVSAFVFGGVPDKAVRKAFSKADIYVSPELLKEYRETPIELLSKGKIDHTQLKVLISGIAAFVATAKIVYPSVPLLICRDAKDNMLLECCLTAKAGILITGDKDLLDIKDLLPFDLKILTPQKHLDNDE